MSDIPRPVQKCFGSDFSEQLEALKSKWDEVIYHKFGLTPPSPFEKDDPIHVMDDLMLAYEFQRFFPHHLKQWPDNEIIISPIEKFNEPIVADTIRGGLEEAWAEEEAVLLFLDRVDSFESA